MKLLLNYGINKTIPGKRRRKQIAHACGKLKIDGDWDDDATHQRIREQIRKLHPGWSVTGYVCTNLKGTRAGT